MTALWACGIVYDDVDDDADDDDNDGNDDYGNDDYGISLIIARN